MCIWEQLVCFALGRLVDQLMLGVVVRVACGKGGFVWFQCSQNKGFEKCVTFETYILKKMIQFLCSFAVFPLLYLTAFVQVYSYNLMQYASQRIPRKCILFKDYIFFLFTGKQCMSVFRNLFFKFACPVISLEKHPGNTIP